MALATVAAVDPGQEPATAALSAPSATWIVDTITSAILSLSSHWMTR